MNTRAAAQAPIDGSKLRWIWIRSAALVSLCWASTVTARPVRVVSINPCIDAILMGVADPAQIAAISHYSQDPSATSIPLAQAMRFRARSGTAEEVMALLPDLVIASGHVAPSTVNALARLHIPLLKLGVPETIAQSLAQTREVVAALGHPERGAASIARVEAAICWPGVPAISARCPP
jgi:iron complex transport system substrate-binding protein